MTNLVRRIGPLAMVLLMLAAPLTGCDTDTTEAVRVADYGKTGSTLALQYAAAYPGRSPGSEQEQAAGDYIIKTLRELGYTPVVTSFDFSIDEENSLTSRNIAVFIEGSGFRRTDADGNLTSFRKQVIIGAHYDTTVSAEQIEAAAIVDSETGTTTNQPGIAGPSLADYTGIQDNASGIAALLTIAREIRNYNYGYDVILVAFGAGTADQAGSNYFASQMSRTEINSTDVMYCIDSIYAGDKVYAHSGRNSILGGDRKDYEKRRKLYEATDVFFDNLLYTNNRYMLYTNQASFLIETEDFEDPVVYREWSLNDSDYLPFDNLGIPVVFFESFDYDEKTVAAMKESQNPAFGPTSGMIRGTRFDSSDYLEKLLNTTRTTAAASNEVPIADQLTRRINNTSFIILEAIAKGEHDAEAG